MLIHVFLVGILKKCLCKSTSPSLRANINLNDFIITIALIVRASISVSLMLLNDRSHSSIKSLWLLKTGAHVSP